MTSSSQPSLVGQSVRSYSADPQQDDNSDFETVSVHQQPAHPVVHHNPLLAVASSTLDDLILEGALLNNDDDIYNEALLDANGNLKSEKQQEQEVSSSSAVLEPTLSHRLDYLANSSSAKSLSREEQIKQIMKQEQEEEEKQQEEEKKKETTQQAEKQPKEKSLLSNDSAVLEKESTRTKIPKELATGSTCSNGTNGSVDANVGSEVTIPSLELMIDSTLKSFDTHLTEETIYGYSSSKDGPLKADSYTDSPLSQVKSPEHTAVINNPSNKTAFLQRVSSFTGSMASNKENDPHPPEHILEQDAQFVPPAAAREGTDLSVTNSYKLPNNPKEGEADDDLKFPVRPSLATGDSYQNTNSNSGLNNDLSDNTKRYLKTLSKTFSYKSENSSNAPEGSELTNITASREPLLRVASYSLTKDDLENEGGLVGASAYDADPSMGNTVDKVLEKVESLSVSNKGGENEDIDNALEKIIDEVNFEMENETIHRENPKSTKLPEIKTNLAYDESTDQEAPKSPLEKLANEILESDVLNSDVKKPVSQTKKQGKKSIVPESAKVMEKSTEDEKLLTLKSENVEENAYASKSATKAAQHSKATVSSIDQIASEIDDLLSGTNPEEPPLTDTQIKELERSLDTDVLTVTHSLQVTNSYTKRPNINPLGSSSNVNASSTSLLPQQDDKAAENAFHDEMQQQIINDLKDQPVYIYTSLAAGSLEMIPRTNRLGTILTAYKIPHTYKDLGTDLEARKIWKTYGRGKQLPAVVRSSDIIGDWKEMDQYAEDYEIRKRIYEMY